MLNKRALSGIAFNEPKTEKSLGRFFFDCCNALDGDSRYDNIVNLIECRLQQHHTEMFEKVTEYF